jgi:hypothetical protein
MKPKQNSVLPKLLAGCGCLLVVVLFACGGTGAYLYSTGALQQFTETAQTAASELIAIQSEIGSQHGSNASDIRVNIANNNGKVSLRVDLGSTPYAALPATDREAKAVEIARLVNSKLSNTLGVREICVGFADGSGSSTSTYVHCVDRAKL